MKPNHFEKIAKSKIVEVIIDKEFEGVYLKFENEYVLHHNTFIGSEFTIEKYQEIFTETGDLR